MILVGDDDKRILSMIKRGLADDFDEVMLFSDAESLIDQIEKEFPIRLVITDWNYGTPLSGKNVVLKCARWGVPCIVYSAMPGRVAEQATRVVTKGGPVYELIDAVKEVLK